MSRFWLDRPVLVTGATGLVGGWVVRRLRNCGADVVCLVRDWAPGSDLVQSGIIDEIRVVRGDVCDQNLLERALGEYETDTVIHLAAQTIVPIANRRPRLKLFGGKLPNPAEPAKFFRCRRETVRHQGLVPIVA